MKINTKNLVSITEANQNFSKVARLVDEQGSAVILKNNNPKYVIIKYTEFESEQNADDECITEISKRILKQNKKAYNELSK
ncbi:MAG: type II toxin-antitoxin system Phd/YefM family antitoxin [Finegoldia magna]|uniref:type II toxin-antitoxin system Phd/YefM family antitoxin n=1 Tax=Finegoldia TaxID=150022 RepID=UPI0012AF7094|nr:MULTISPECIES: type II toxin-antitoxin system Phd/YefM family antitoxin [Finegoldia]MDU2500654.1 type II toxin-antitoxin system Phd/YefM family antitoxin [Finegoldia magna]MDU2640112.1 type II toxin-antitoxin system Phd/YefM family antitoxin [Finegoldia magna]MSB11287.1 type II toxin-antitoxin system Phd/YefM family antitoxin [Finegoldia sp. BIOML-A1]